MYTPPILLTQLAISSHSHLRTDHTRNDHLQPSDNVPSDQSLHTANEQVYHRHDPDKLPVPPLHGYGVPGGSHVHANHEDKGPVDGEAPHGVSIVEVSGLRATHGKGPVERREWRRAVADRLYVDYCLEEVVASTMYQASSL